MKHKLKCSDCLADQTKPYKDLAEADKLRYFKEAEAAGIRNSEA